MIYDQSEYDQKLGCFLKWIHGNPNEIVEKMYSMSVFHFYTELSGFTKHYTYQKYATYLRLSVESILEKTTDWKIRLYIDESILTEKNEESLVWKSLLEKFKISDRIQIICVKFPQYFFQDSNTHQGLLAVLFRYLALFDPNVGICLFRDIDNIWTEQHNYFVDKWINSNTDICLFLNSGYKRQQISDLTVNDVILEDTFYTTILSGLWNIRKKIGYIFPISIWQKMFAYTESYTDFVNNIDYINYKFYKVRFTYGFDELILTRITLPIFIDMGLTIYAIPIKIYNIDYFKNLFNPSINKFLRTITSKSNTDLMLNIILTKYWDMNSHNAGLSQYLICLITNIYYKIITKQSFIKNEQLINTLKYSIYPVPLLMGIGLFTFKNYYKYEWYPNKKLIAGTNIVDKFVINNERLSFEDLMAGGQYNPTDPTDPLDPIDPIPTDPLDPIPIDPIPIDPTDDSKNYNI
jgi:hypothetical protein